MKPYTYLIYLGLIFSSCQQAVKERAEMGAFSTEDTDNEPFILANNEGGVIPTGVPIPITSKKISNDSTAQVQTLSLWKPLEVRPVPVNAHPVGIPKKVPLPRELKAIIPGKNAIPFPKMVKADGKIVPASYPRPLAAAPLQFKEAAPVHLQYLELDNGIGTERANVIMEDSRGYIWIGTGGGVSRYDGKRIIHYTEKEGLCGNGVRAIKEDKEGCLWFGTWGGGVCRFDGKNFTHYTEKQGFTDNLVRSILIDQQGSVWIGTPRGGICHFDGKKFTCYTKREGLSGNKVYSIFEDSRGRLWFSIVNGGVYCFDGKKFTHYTTQEGLSSDLIFSIMEDNQGNIWFGTWGGGASSFDGKNFYHYTKKEGLASNIIHSLFQDSRGKIWFGKQDTWTGSVSFFDGKNFYHFTEKEGLGDFWISSIQEDSQGRVWLGRNRYDETGFTHYTKHNGLDRLNMIHSIVEDEAGGLWLGTWGSGLLRFDGERFTSYQTEGFNHSIVNSIVMDHNGQLWIDTGSRGVLQFNPHQTSSSRAGFLLDRGLDMPLLEDSRGRLWFTDVKGGIGFYDGEISTHFTKKEGLGIYPVESMIEGRRGDFWFGTWGGGVSHYDGKTITHFTEKEGLISNNIKALLEDNRGYLWLGGPDGVSCFDPNSNRKTLIHFTEEEGLGHNMAYCLMEDARGYIWVGRYKGLSVIIPGTSWAGSQSNVPMPLSKVKAGDFHIHNYGTEYGLKGKQFRSIFLDSQNRLWAGSDKGLSMLDLSNFDFPDEPPRIRLDHIEIAQQFVDYRRLVDTAYLNTIPFGKKLIHCCDSITPFFNYPGRLDLPYKLNHLTFHFSAIEWAAPSKIQYSYRIEGLDKNWSIPQIEPLADYRNLPSGSHTLQVKAAGEGGYWSEPFEYRFTILPPWYRTWLAYFLYVLAAAGLLFNIWRYELRRQLARAEARQLKELDAFKTRLYTNITHEFRTPLTVILGIAHEVKSDPGRWLEKGIHMIRRNGQQLLRLVNQMLDLAKLESGNLELELVNGDIISYLAYLAESFHSFAESKKIELVIYKETEHLEMDYDPDKVLHIVSNLLSNAIKYTPEGGRVIFHTQQIVKNGRPFLRAKVRDNGAGIPEADLPNIFGRFYQVDDSTTRKGEGTGIGLALARELARMMEGDIEVSSTLGEGTEFVVILPVRNTLAAGLGEENLDNVQEKLSLFLTDKTKESLATPSAYADEKGQLVLVVEDNVDVAHYLLASLESNYRIELAYNGQEGIDKALEIVPDIIISDVMMPEKDGFELCDFLKNDEKTSHIPIVLLTAKADIASKIIGLKRGADVYLPKPFDQEELRAHLENLIRQRKKLQERYQGILPAPVSGDIAIEMEDAFLQKIKKLVEKQLNNSDFDITKLAHLAGMSRTQLFRKIKALTNKSPSLFVRSIRLQNAKTLLLTTNLNISEIAYDVGFSTPAMLSKTFREEFGKSPSEFRENERR